MWRVGDVNEYSNGQLCVVVVCHGHYAVLWDAKAHPRGFIVAQATRSEKGRITEWIDLDEGEGGHRDFRAAHLMMLRHALENT